MSDFIFTSLYLWATCQALLLGLIILLVRANSANAFLSVFFVLTSLNVVFQYLLIFTGFRDLYPETVFVSDAIGFCYGPVLYLYYRQLIFEKMEPSQWLHFAPALLYIFYFFVVELVISGPFQFEHYIDQPHHVLVLCLILISNISYLFACFYSIHNNQQLRGAKEFRLISWLYLLVVVVLLKTILNLFIFTFHTVLGANVFDVMRFIKDVIFIGSTVIIISAAQWFLIRHPEIILHGTQAEQDEDEDDEQGQIGPVAADDTEDQYSSDSQEGLADAATQAQRLESLMLESKLHLDAELTEKILAEKLGVPSYYLSRLLNQFMGKRFNEYINEKRVAEAKRLLLAADSGNKTMFAISLDAGFKSESVFYTNFKKYTGMTPRVFKVKQGS